MEDYAKQDFLDAQQLPDDRFPEQEETPRVLAGVDFGKDLDLLDVLVKKSNKYDDGQGRQYDIIDEELE